MNIQEGLGPSRRKGIDLWEASMEGATQPGFDDSIQSLARKKMKTSVKCTTRNRILLITE